MSNLRRGNYEAVHEQVARALKFKLDPSQAVTAREILAEAHFRAAMADTALDDRLYHLDAALQQTPDAAKVHFYRGITLWQLGLVAEALSELDATAARQPDRRGLAYLRASARIATGQPWETAGLTPAEANTLRLVQGLVQRKPRGPLPTCRSLCSAEGPSCGRRSSLCRRMPRLRPRSSSRRRQPKHAQASRPYPALLQRRGRDARAGNRDAARAAWLSAQNTGLTSPGLTENLTALLRGEAVELAEEGRWQDLADLISRLPAPGADRIVAETAAWPIITWAMTRRRRASGLSPSSTGAKLMNWTPTATCLRTWRWRKKRWETGSMPPRPGERWCAGGRARRTTPTT